MNIKFSLTFKFLIPIFIIFVVIAGFLSYQTSVFVKGMVIEQTKNLVVNFVQFHTKKYVTSASDFSLASPERAEQVFNQVLGEVKTGDIMRIKVWGENATVVFSDDKTIIGKQFADNKEFQESMEEGKVEVEIKQPLKAENIQEKGYRQLMEVYVPITLNGDSKPSGVVETYYNMDALNSSIQKAQTQMVLINLGSFIVLAVILWLLFHFLVVRPLKELESGMIEIKEKGV